MCNDYSKTAWKAKYKSIFGGRLALVLATRLNMLPPKQILQKLPIALAHVKARNTFANLLN